MQSLLLCYFERKTTKETTSILSFYLTNDMPKTQHATFTILSTGAIQSELFGQLILPYCYMITRCGDIKRRNHITRINLL